MTVKAPLRVNQPSTTSGTGTYSLGTVASCFQTFRTYYTTGAVVLYFATDFLTGWEVGKGTLTYGTPDTISRDTIFGSSNSGSAVSWSGNNLSIQAWEPAGSRYVNAISGNKVLDVTDWGNNYVYTGTGGNTITLPALSTCPLGWTIKISNQGSGILTLALNGGDTFTGTAKPTRLLIGDCMEIGTTLSNWILTDWTNFMALQAAIASGAGGL